MEPDFGETKLAKTSIHFVGNKSRDEGIRYSEQELDIDNSSIKNVLFNYFLSPIQKAEYYTFSHDYDLNQNEVYQLVNGLFGDELGFHEYTKKIASHLYSHSDHPNIKSGELYTTYFRDILIGDELVDGVGIFKSESKDVFIKVYPEGDGFGVKSEEGININKLDKGALILNVEKSSGYAVAVIDSTNRGNEAKYWKDDFLGVITLADDYNQTKNFLKMSKDFVEDTLENYDRSNQIDIVNRSVKYFTENEVFDQKDYFQEVLQKPELIDSFEQYSKEYIEQKSLPNYNEQFEVSKPALKKTKKYIRSVIKLDKDFHLYVHGSKEKIERGFDVERGLNYYKIFFEEES